MVATRKKKRQNRSGEQTRAALIDAARAEFLEAGYVGASMRRIARNAGVHQYAVQYHFGGKVDLYRAMVQSYVQRFVSQFQLPRSGAAEDRVGQFARHYIAFIRDNPEMPSLTQRMLVERDPEAIAVVAESVGPMFNLLRMVVPPDVPDSEVHAGMMGIIGFAVAPYAYAPLLSQVGVHVKDYGEAHGKLLQEIVTQVIKRSLG